MITDDILRHVMPNLPEVKRAAMLQPLQAAMDEFEITTPKREAAFLAQLAHESGEFRWMEEIWGPTKAQEQYEPPHKKAKGLGNTKPGDGKRFKGRGPIQLTGRSNYEKFGNLLGLDLVNEPRQAAEPAVGFRIAGLYWKKNGLNESADAEMFKTITLRINGGLNGLDDRRKYYDRAKEALGVPFTRGFLEPDGEGDLPPVFTRGHEIDTIIPPVTKAKDHRERRVRSTATSRAIKKPARKKSPRALPGKKKSGKTAKRSKGAKPAGAAVKRRGRKA